MARKNTTDNSVTVACKLPQGLHIKIPELKIDLKLHGSASPYAVAGHGITRGIDASLWEAVEDHFAGAAWLKNEAVFSMARVEDANDKAVERKDARIGFERIDQKDPSAQGFGRIVPADFAE